MDTVDQPSRAGLEARLRRGRPLKRPDIKSGGWMVTFHHNGGWMVTFHHNGGWMVTFNHNGSWMVI